jgi:hypothetical protein
MQQDHQVVWRNHRCKTISTKVKQDRKGNHRKSVNCPKRTYSHSEIGHSHGDNWVSVRSSLHNKMGQSFRDNLIEWRHVDGNDVCCQVRILE